MGIAPDIRIGEVSAIMDAKLKMSDVYESSVLYRL
jgi:hypothetical protein